MDLVQSHVEKNTDITVSCAAVGERRVYVGGLPPTANEQSVATFFSQVMAKLGGTTAGPDT
ncbi:Splicing factor U2af large subunit B [Glycine soja]|uniref:Splicing factor U2af large subunit B n=1 Tax=Glycine soja TaxID=3848 RepID=A0A0B2RGM4_GLYSO|nr:Splicing factor U2af large subunit B [Glycine soja]